MDCGGGGGGGGGAATESSAIARGGRYVTNSTQHTWRGKGCAEGCVMAGCINDLPLVEVRMLELLC